MHLIFLTRGSWGKNLAIICWGEQRFTDCNALRRTAHKADRRFIDVASQRLKLCWKSTQRQCRQSASKKEPSTGIPGRGLRTLLSSPVHRSALPLVRFNPVFTASTSAVCHRRRTQQRTRCRHWGGNTPLVASLTPQDFVRYFRKLGTSGGHHFERPTRKVFSGPYFPFCSIEAAVEESSNVPLGSKCVETLFDYRRRQ